MPSRISAIVPTYNRAGYLGEALGAILSQVRPVDEVLVWDDGSTDGTEDVLRRIAPSAGGRLRWHRAPNAGKSRALNAALERTGGDLVWICDDDDVALPDATARLAAPLEDDASDGGRAGLSAGPHERFRDEPGTGRRTLMGRGYWPDLARGSVLRHLLEDVFFFQNASLVRREALARAGPFREDLARSIDYDMFVRLAARHPVAMVEGTVFLQRKHDGGRGPAAARHAAAGSDAVWADADRRVFEGLRRALPLSLYEAMFEASEPLLARRAALLQRGCVHARRGDWGVALDDWEAALTVGAGPLTAVERDVLRRAMAGKHGARGAFAEPHASRLVSLRRAGPEGRAAARALGRGAVWRLREAVRARSPGEAARIAALIARSGTGPGSVPDDGARITERRALPAEAYAW